MKRAALAFAVAIAVTGALFSPSALAAQQATLASAGELEARMLHRLNALRASRGLASLRVSPGLSSAARHHTKDMARRGYCGHDSANGAPFWKRVSRFYGRRAGWRTWMVAENVLCYPQRLTAAAALRKWLGSPGHRANLLAPQWREIGLAAVYDPAAPGEFRGQDVLLVTADFGVRR